MAMVGDGRTTYDNANDGESNIAGSCESDFRRKLLPTKGKITYYRESGALNVSFIVFANTE
jgi:mannose-binding lectin 2